MRADVLWTKRAKERSRRITTRYSRPQTQEDADIDGSNKQHRYKCRNELRGGGRVLGAGGR